jgi:hypothetical protein
MRVTRSPFSTVVVPMVLLVVSLPAACSDSGDPSGATEAPRGRLDIAYFPDPAVGAPAPGGSPGFVTRVEMRIREMGGVGVRLTQLQVGVSTDPSSTQVLGTDEIVARGGSDRVASRGLLVLRVEISYGTADSFGDIQVVIEGMDDLGQPVDYTGGLPIR